MDDTKNIMDSSTTSISPDIHEQTNSEESKASKLVELDEQVMSNFQKNNMPNVNVPERIIICLDVCYDDQNSLYRLGDGTTYTSIDMLKRVLDFFIYSKHAINKKTEFALLILKDSEPCYLHSFTNNVKDLINTIDYVNSEESTKDNFDFHKVFNILKQETEIPEYKQSECLQPPPFVVRLVVLYARSNCVPIINQDDPYFNFLKKQPYFFVDILFAHEDSCALYRCEKVYDTLQDLDDGYSYIFEVSRNAAKIHECVAKLLAHPLQRPLQKNADYIFPSRLVEY